MTYRVVDVADVVGTVTIERACVHGGSGVGREMLESGREHGRVGVRCGGVRVVVVRLDPVQERPCNTSQKTTRLTRANSVCGSCMIYRQLEIGLDRIQKIYHNTRIT